MALIEIADLSREFRRGDETILALNHVSLTIEGGEFVSITGPSGSGKSTLLYILGLIDRQTSGSYILDGTLTDNLSDDQRAKLRNQNIGFIFQSFHLLPRATALRNVMMPLVYSASYDASLSESLMIERAAAALKRVGLQERMNHRPNELSGGQRQRVAIARALINNPRILFADEPTGNLDSKTGKDILALFNQLSADGVTILLVSHDPAISSAAKRRIMLRDGLIEKEEHSD